MFDRRAWILNLIPHLKGHRLEGKALDDVVVQMLQQGVFQIPEANKFSIPAVTLTASSSNPTPMMVASLCLIPNIVI